MIRAFRRLPGLPRDERRMLIGAAAMLPLVTLSLWIVGLKSTSSMLARFSSSTGTRHALAVDPSQRAVRVGALVAAASAYGLVRGTCLAQSLTIAWLLRRRGILTDLRIGVCRQHARLEAHAWIEYRGRVLNRDAGFAGRFRAFDDSDGVLAQLGADLP
jgi:hypothetical protein